MAKTKSFRVGKVRADLRGKVWYLTYHENGRRVRPRLGSDKTVARQMAAQINAQLETSAPTAFSFEPIRIDELQQRWLDHHEQVLRSSVQTIRRYRTATAHLIRFISDRFPKLKTSQFQTYHGEQFVRYLRSIRVAPNGHENSQKRPLLDKGVRFILATCRSMFAFAARRRHLSPYAENPFGALDLDRIPIENMKPIVILTPEQEQAFLEACDDWQFPMFLTLMLTGFRPGELTHLLLPDDVDLIAGVLRIQNKARLGWQVKTRNEREVPLVKELVDVLGIAIGSRTSGPVFLRRRFHDGSKPRLHGQSSEDLVRELVRRVSEAESQRSSALDRTESLTIARGVWRDAGAIKTDRVRNEFMRLTRQIELP